MFPEPARPDHTAARPDKPVPLPRRAAEALTRARAICEPALRESVGTLPEPLRRMAAYHFGWCDSAGFPTQADSGKALRPALTTCTADACGTVSTAVGHVAAAVELVHNFALIHDDIIDGDHTRRGRPAVWTLWGKADAILLGDTLHALASRVLADTLPDDMAVDAIARLEAAVIEMCRGQREDCRLENRTDTGVAEYERMAMGKTGALMGCACALGALCAGAEESTVAAMDDFGRQLGLAFQFTDDLIGIWGDPQVTGKPADDLAQRKRSLPVVAALRSGTDAADELAQVYRSNTTLDPVEVAHLAMLVETSGGREQAQYHADQRIRAAIATLPDHLTDSALMSLAYLVAHRDR